MTFALQNFQRTFLGGSGATVQYKAEYGSGLVRDLLSRAVGMGRGPGFQVLGVFVMKSIGFSGVPMATT
jgi:hypothetical protein